LPGRGRRSSSTCRSRSPRSRTSRAGLDDLGALGLRTAAGEFRDRGGHDLRAWFITSCQQQGAHRDLLRVVTHTAKGDHRQRLHARDGVASCAEVGKLKVSVLDGKLLELATTGEGTGTAGQISWAL